jgi:hypothetical protein
MIADAQAQQRHLTPEELFEEVYRASGASSPSQSAHPAAHKGPKGFDFPCGTCLLKLWRREAATKKAFSIGLLT